MSRKYYRLWSGRIIFVQASSMRSYEKCGIWNNVVRQWSKEMRGQEANLDLLKMMMMMIMMMALRKRREESLRNSLWIEKDEGPLRLIRYMVAVVVRAQKHSPCARQARPSLAFFSVLHSVDSCIPHSTIPLVLADRDSTHVVIVLVVVLLPANSFHLYTNKKTEKLAKRK